MRARCLRLESRTERGFTLVELMAVVLIVGILAAIGIALAMRHMRAAGAHEAVAGAQKLRALEEAYFSQNGTYLNVSRATGPVWYPAATPGRVTYSWNQNGPDAQYWSQLGATTFGDTRFGYAVNAGLPTEAMPALQTPNFTWPAEAANPQEPWYVIQVRGQRDLEGDALLSGVTTSFNSTVFIDNDTE